MAESMLFREIIHWFSQHWVFKGLSIHVEAAATGHEEISSCTALLDSEAPVKIPACMYGSDARLESRPWFW